MTDQELERDLDKAQALLEKNAPYKVWVDATRESGVY
jgi:hypothetical protein